MLVIISTNIESSIFFLIIILYPNFNSNILTTKYPRRLFRGKPHDASGKKAAVVVVSALSNRLHTVEIDPKEDRIHSLKDHEWNSKFLEYLEKGRLEDVSQLSRQFHNEARVPKVVSFKPFWIMASIMGQNNLYDGNVLAYEPICGTGAAVVTLTPAEDTAGDLEYDEDDPEFYKGDREVLDFYDQPGMGPLEERDGD